MDASVSRHSGCANVFVCFLTFLRFLPWKRKPDKTTLVTSISGSFAEKVLRLASHTVCTALLCVYVYTSLMLLIVHSFLYLDAGFLYCSYCVHSLTQTDAWESYPEKNTEKLGKNTQEESEYCVSRGEIRMETNTKNGFTKKEPHTPQMINKSISQLGTWEQTLTHSHSRTHPIYQLHYLYLDVSFHFMRKECPNHWRAVSPFCPFLKSQFSAD